MKTLLLSLIMTTAFALQSGDTAPQFKAIATDGKTISLSDYIGKSNVVLYFYPEDMTGGCTREACEFRNDLPKYVAANTVVLGVSMDSQEKHQQFTEKEKLNFPLLVDGDGAICKAYGVPVDDRNPHRWTFLISKEGKIIKSYQKVDPRSHSVELLKDLADFQAAHTN
ncbi:MAG: peroxiredoxin [Candidatus Kapaibacterium sp.]|jgi:peroxiredoxin Q/BCP